MQLGLIAAVISTSLLVLSCSTSTLYPPEPGQEKEHQWGRLLASGQANECESLWELYSSHPNFPAREVITLKLLKNCSLKESELLSIWEQDISTFGTYIQRSMLEESYRVAIKQQLTAEAAGFAFELITRAERQDERINWIKQVRVLATSSGRNDLLDQLPLLEAEVAPHLIKNPSKDQLYKVARDLERQREFKQARDYYQQIMKDPRWKYEEKIQAYDRFAMSFKLERDKETYTKETARTVAWLQSLANRTSAQNKDLEERWMEWARAEWTQDRLEIGHAELVKLTRAQFVSANARAKSYWLLGMMERERKNLKLAFAFFELGARETITDSDIKEKIEWAISWNRFQSGEYQAAITSFERYLASTDDVESETTLRFAYWMAVSYKKLGDEKKAQELLSEIISNNPVSYYALLAYKHLGRPLAPIAYEYPQAEPLDLKASWLLYMNETEVLKEYLKSFKGRDKTLTVTPFFERAGAYREGMLAGFRLQSEYEFAEISSLLYPKAYQDQFTAGARKFNVPPYLLMAIARQESAFDTNARSFADAFGLLQVIPEKAKQYANQAGAKYSALEDLYTPEVNITVAAFMIKKLMANSNDNLIQAIASYNAGEAPVRKWIDSRFNGDWEQFVETIPYEETRNYVKLVLRNFLVYHKLNLSEEKLLPPELVIGQR